MDDLTQWLGEQLDEDERGARAATRGPWVQSGIGDYGWTVDFGHAGAGVETADSDQGLADADFIAAHNPARVLHEIEAKRSVLTQYKEAATAWRSVSAVDDWSPEEASHIERAGYPQAVAVLARVVKMNALVYADRPGYREEWRPS